MVKSILKDYRKIAAPVEVRVNAADETEAASYFGLWGADEKNLVLMSQKHGLPSPRSIPWRNVERIEVTLTE